MAQAFTISGQDAFVKYFVGALVRAMKDEAAQLPDLMTALVIERMHDGRNPNPDAINTTSKVYERKGGLKRSFILGQAGNTGKVVVRPEGVRFEFGSTSVVAAVHENGATIPITAKMRRFFWAKYFETKADMWRGLALTKKSAVTIPPRPFFADAVKELETTELPDIMEAIFKRMAQVLK